MPIFDVDVTISMSIPVEAEDEEQAAFLVSQDEEGQYVARHLSDGDWGMGVIVRGIV